MIHRGLSQAAYSHDPKTETHTNTRRMEQNPSFLCANRNRRNVAVADEVAVTDSEEFHRMIAVAGGLIFK